MTDQRTLKKIIVEQREKIEKLENQIKTVEAVLKDYYFPQTFRDGRRGVRDKCGKEPCDDCYIDQDTCLQKHRLFERISIALNYQQEKQEKKTGMRKYCICGQKLTVAKEDGMFDGKGSIYCPACGLIHRKKPKQSNKPKTMENK